jgi:hypothetical protein
MSAVTPISTEIKIRFPIEMLEGIEHWAAAHNIPRSRAIRLLIYRGFAHVGRCDCAGRGPDSCSGNCK